MAYDTPLPVIAEEAATEEEAACCPILMTARDFSMAVSFGSFSDDGVGHPVRNGLVNRRLHIDPPSTTYIPDDATHVLWYPK